MLRKSMVILLVILGLALIGCTQSGDSSSSSGGCCSGGCGGCCGQNDLSKDSDSDGNSGREQIPTRLNNPAQQAQQNTRPNVCENLNVNRVSITADRSPTQTGFTYEYSYTIDACSSVSGFGYIVRFSGSPDLAVESGGIASGRSQTTGSNTIQSRSRYTEVCVVTSEPQEYCERFS